MSFVTRAPAKINLTLHIRGRRADGYHELESLVAFTGAGDVLHFDPGDDLSLEVVGPTAVAAGESGDNLVLRAARALRDRVPALRLGAFKLVKRLPVAAGVGGGSSDAAAALRLLADANALSHHDPRLVEAAQATGADVPVCLDPRARMMSGIGERLGAPLRLPPLVALLINPGVKLETKSVFHRIGLRNGETNAGSSHPEVGPDLTPNALMPLLRRGRNDMEGAAGVLAPVIGDVLAVLGGARGCRLARMSGSGATCFGLFDTCRAAAQAMQIIRAQHPDWWVKATVLR
ncbi:4-(cytidine 5'-diphospho)-2-C-methyl-D-erythritol kinase [Lichenihabitans sp. Uapishka_5]|uniref:4-(cytidine 5'-diphospho)-2-C-methyl-D-erythritol kinase n=1 Tax=Lichenihabitans sp. Uapishka_5 TaxID=3037302 RepID=UPI0029E7E6F1|nr:4-(cytidine 5'-diphospho)-2-C-methyl-D-erythritol kinase [Lichenihabitans sp. Uapishka_5]MDX7949952.1 4-(cytidine 5'-diphospho)-2-C-methyl-D-erythritol kinase [Lichenihabitans sp. Uapishka_5]